MGLLSSLFNFKSKKDAIIKTYYSDYPEIPFISDEREISEWIERAKLFPSQTIIPRTMMKRYSDGLLPGHVYMLYWLKKYNDKKAPSYFEYKYGINFNKEKLFLVDNGFLENNKPTQKGEEAIKRHYYIVEKHSPKRKVATKEDIEKITLTQKNSIVKNGFKYYEYIASMSACVKCKALDGKISPISQLKPGINAPPMCDSCKCSICAISGESNKEYTEWIDFLDNGGTTEEKHKRIAK